VVVVPIGASMIKVLDQQERKQMWKRVYVGCKEALGLGRRVKYLCNPKTGVKIANLEQLTQLKRVGVSCFADGEEEEELPDISGKLEKRRDEKREKLEQRRREQAEAEARRAEAMVKEAKRRKERSMQQAEKKREQSEEAKEREVERRNARKRLAEETRQKAAEKKKHGGLEEEAEKVAERRAQKTEQIRRWHESKKGKEEADGRRRERDKARKRDQMRKKREALDQAKRQRVAQRKSEVGQPWRREERGGEEGKRPVNQEWPMQRDEGSNRMGDAGPSEDQGDQPIPPRKSSFQEWQAAVNEEQAGIAVTNEEQEVETQLAQIRGGH
jgi:hypothetical protein